MGYDVIPLSRRTVPFLSNLRKLVAIYRQQREAARTKDLTARILRELQDLFASPINLRPFFCTHILTYRPRSTGRHNV